MVQINDASWITSPSLAVYLPNTILDFGEVIDSSSPALVRLRIRSLLAYPSQLCLVRQPTSQLNLSVQEYNPNIDLEPLYRINTFNVVEVVSQGPFIHLQAQEDREIIVSLYPGGFTGRGTGLQRFNALPFRSTLRLSLDGHVIEIGICARICRSQVVFGTRELLVDCAAGNTDVKTISVHNLSEFATFFSISILNGNDHSFAFTEFGSGIPLQALHPIAGFSEIVIQVSLCPDNDVVVESSSMMLLENVLDSRNTDRIPIYLAITSETREDGLQLSSSVVDFGDCLAGEVTGKTFVLRNTTQAPIEVFLSSNGAKPDRIWFILEDSLTISSCTSTVMGTPSATSEDENDDFNIPLGGSATSLQCSRAPSFSRLPGFNRDVRIHFRKPSSSVAATEKDTNPLKNTVEELTILPGKERQMRILFLSPIKYNVPLSTKDVSLDSAPLNANDAFSADRVQLSPFNARVFLNYYRSGPAQSSTHVRYLKSIQCIGRICTSLVRVHPLVVDFGEIPLMVPASKTFTIENLSDMPTSVFMEFESKVLTVSKNPVDLAARSKAEVRLKLVPQKRAALYQKEIQLSNLRNPHDNHSLMVLSQNTDRLKFHSHLCFYDVNFVDGPTNNELIKVDFGKVVTNCPHTRVFTIRNNSAGIITIQFLSASTEDVAVYHQAASNPDGNHKEEVQLSSLVSHEHPDTSPWFPDADEQRESVEKEIERLKYFQKCVKDGLLNSIDQVEIAVEETVSLLLVYCLKSDVHPYLHGKLKNLPAKLNLRLASAHGFSGAEVASVPDCIVNIQAMVCRTSFHFALKHINFGILNNLARRHFNLIISNMSDISVQYSIIKTRSIASDDLDCPLGYTGILRPYQIKEIPIIFKPCLAGRFLETLTFQNVQDPNDKQVICVKADIKKPYNFWVQTVVLDFGYCLLGERSRRKRLLIKNISERTRKLCVKVDSTSFPKGNPIVFEPGDLSLGPAMSNVDRDEEREKLEGKLRIAERKGQKDKIKKIRRRLSEIRQESATDSSLNDVELKQDDDKVNTSNSLMLTLPPNAVQNVFVTFNSEQLNSNTSSHSKLRIEAIRGTILVYEDKNKDYIRDLSFWAYICKDSDVYQKAITGTIPLLSPFNVYSKRMTETAPRLSRRARNQSRSASSSPVRKLFRSPLITANELVSYGAQTMLTDEISGVSIHIPSNFVFDLDDSRIVMQQPWQTVADGFARRILTLPIPLAFLPGPFSLPVIHQWPFIVISPKVRKGSSSVSATAAAAAAAAAESSLSINWVCDDKVISESVWLCISVVDKSAIESVEVSDIPLLMEGKIIEPSHVMNIAAIQTAVISFKSSENIVVSLKWHSGQIRWESQWSGPVTGLLSLTVLDVTHTLRVVVIPPNPCLSVYPPRVFLNPFHSSQVTITNTCKKAINLAIFSGASDPVLSFSANGCPPAYRRMLCLEPEASLEINMSCCRDIPLRSDFVIVIRDFTNYEEQQVLAIIRSNDV